MDRCTMNEIHQSNIVCALCKEEKPAKNNQFCSDCQKEIWLKKHEIYGPWWKSLTETDESKDLHEWLYFITEIAENRVYHGLDADSGDNEAEKLQKNEWWLYNKVKREIRKRFKAK